MMSLHIFPEFDEGFERETLWSHRVSFVIDEIGHLVCLRSIGDHEKRESMDTCEYPSMQTHPDDSMEGWIELHRLFDSIGSIISTTRHESLDEECIILSLISFGGMQEKYRIISLLDEIVIDLRDFIFVISEKSSPDRDADTFFLWHLLDFLRDSEKCNIWNMRTRDLKGFEESCTLLISDDDEVSLLEELTEHHFVFYLFNLEGYTEVHDRSPS
jgi:hypothetical protein